jgi:hypothetical protein
MADDGCRVSMGMGKGPADHPDIRNPWSFRVSFTGQSHKNIFLVPFTLYKKSGEEPKKIKP